MNNEDKKSTKSNENCNCDNELDPKPFNNK